MRYQHFRGGFYKYITSAVHTETGEELIVYGGVRGATGIHARPKSMFLGQVALFAGTKDQYESVTVYRQHDTYGHLGFMSYEGPHNQFKFTVEDNEFYLRVEFHPTTTEVDTEWFSQGDFEVQFVSGMNVTTLFAARSSEVSSTVATFELSGFYSTAINHKGEPPNADIVDRFTQEGSL